MSKKEDKPKDDIPQSSINFIKYHPDKELDPLFERFLLWSSHILPYNQDEIIKKCEALQKIRNKFRENYTEAKNGLIDVLNKMNSSLMKLLNDEQLITIFDKQLKQLSKINKIKYEPIEDYEELYKKNHELYDNLPDYQKERFLYSNLNKNILKYFGLYKSVKERKINNLIDDRLREYNIIKEKDLKRKKEEQEKEDKVMQEIKKSKTTSDIQTAMNSLNENTVENYKILWNLYNDAMNLKPKVEEIKDNVDFTKTGFKIFGKTLDKFLSILPLTDQLIKQTQTNPNTVRSQKINDVLSRLQKLYNSASMVLNNDKVKLAYTASKVKTTEPPKTEVKKEVKEEVKAKPKEEVKEEIKEEVKPTGELAKVEVKVEPPKAEPSKSKIDLILDKITLEDIDKDFYENGTTGSGKRKKPIRKLKSQTTLKKDKVLKAKYNITNEDIKLLRPKIEAKKQQLLNSTEEIKQPEPQPQPQPEQQPELQKPLSKQIEDNHIMRDMEDRLFKLQIGEDNKPYEEIYKGFDNPEEITGSGLLGSLIKGIGSIFGLGSNVLSDDIVKELLKYQNQKDGNKIIDSIIIWELMHRHKYINKSKYPEIIKEFDKKHRPKLFYVRSKFKKYNNTDKFLGGFPLGLLAGIIPGALQGVSSIISAIKGNGCGSWSAGTPSSLDKVKGSLKKTKTNNLKGGKSMTLQDLNNIKQNIKN